MSNKRNFYMAMTVHNMPFYYVACHALAMKTSERCAQAHAESAVA